MQTDSRHRAITAQWLAALRGVSVVQVASDGAEALALVEALPPDVILVDASRAGLDGFEFTRMAKSNGGTYRVVMMIALESPHFVASAHRAGADDAVEKSRLHTELPLLLARYASLAGAAPDA